MVEVRFNFYTPYNNTYKKANSEVTKNVDFEYGNSVALLIGIDFGINWSQVLDAIITLFK